MTIKRQKCRKDGKMMFSPDFSVLFFYGFSILMFINKAITAKDNSI